jgi:hypothetical protein
VFHMIKESLSDFHLASYLIEELQNGSVDSVSKLWEDISTTFPSIPDLSVSSLLDAVFSRHIRQTTTILPRIIRVCRLFINLEVLKILEKNVAESMLTKTVLKEIRKETMVLFNEDKTPTLKVLKMDLSKVKGTKCDDCCGCQIHCVDYHTTWCGPRFHKHTKTAGKSDVRELLTNVEEDVYLDHEGNLVTVDDDFSQSEMMDGLAQQPLQQTLKTEV